MQNCRVLVGQLLNVYLPLPLRCIPYSSDYRDKQYKTLPENITNKDKIKTDKLRKLVVFLRKKTNNDHIMYNLVRKQATSIGKELSSSYNLSEEDKKLDRLAKDIKNIFDDVQEMDGIKKEKIVLAESLYHWDDQYNTNSNPNKKYHGLVDSVTLENGISVSRGGPDLRNSTESSISSTYLADLSSATLPLPLHQKDKSLFVDALVQDVNQLHLKASEILSSYQLVKSKNYLETGTKKLEGQSRSGQILKKKTAAYKSTYTYKSFLLFNYESKTSTAKTFTIIQKTEYKTTDKIKKTMGDVITALKQKISKQKKPDIKK